MSVNFVPRQCFRTVSKIRKPWVYTTCRSVGRYRPGPLRTRFAPSPTGHLHLGSLRTALFNFLSAKAKDGQFIIRLEDTDKRRTVDDSEERLYQDLKWAGLQWDEGPDIGGPYGPYRQSERTAIYQESAQALLKSKHAYRCFCSSERLNNLAKERRALGLPTEYDRTCLALSEEESDERASKGEAHVIRLQMPERLPILDDLVYGKVGKPKRNGQSLGLKRTTYEDPILIKSDGSPTYHLASVVDDHKMDINFVIRATEWMPSTPKHLYLYAALGWKPPGYAHVGLLQNKNREKFSKRHGHLDIRTYRQDGIFPEALVNYAVLFGWSHKHRSDVMSMQDLIDTFPHKSAGKVKSKFTKGEIIVEPTKLIYFQKTYASKYVREMGPEVDSMIDNVYAAVKENFSLYPGSPVPETHILKDQIRDLLTVDAKNFVTPKEFLNRHIYFFRSIAPPADQVLSEGQEAKPFADDYGDVIRKCFEQILPHDWTEDKLKERILQAARDVASAKSVDLNADIEELEKINKIVLKYFRWALTGGLPGPALSATMKILGRDTVLQRLREAGSKKADRDIHEYKFDKPLSLTEF